MTTFEITYSHATDSVALPGDGDGPRLKLRLTRTSPPLPRATATLTRTAYSDVQAEPLTDGTRTLIL